MLTTLAVAIASCKQLDMTLNPSQRNKVSENTDRSNPNVPKLSDDRGCLDRYCQGGNRRDPHQTPSDDDRSRRDRYF